MSSLATGNMYDSMNFYYRAPEKVVFDEVKKKAIEIWKELGAHPSYEQEKVSRVEAMGNVGDNFMTIVAMFDSNNRKKLAGKLSEDARAAIARRMIAGGSIMDAIIFNREEK